MTEVIKKLYRVQKEINNLPANAANPFFKSKYIPLNEILDYIRPKLDKHGLVLIQSGSRVIDGYFTIETNIYDSESGESIGNIISMPAIADAQKMSAAMTYGKRTGLSAFFNIVADVDDDGNSLADKPKTDETKKHYAGKLDFNDVKKQAENMNIDELNKYSRKLHETYPNISENQKSALRKIFGSLRSAINQDSFDNLNPVADMFEGEK